MDTKDLKLLAAEVIYKSEMSKPSKLQMFEYIDTASSAQLKALIMDGKITKLDEQAEEIVNDRFEVHPLSEANPKMAMAVKKCGGLSGDKKKACFQKMLKG